jgi:hypothetical protein
MPALTLKTHFDGERIQLDEPFELPVKAPLTVTVLALINGTENTAWAQVAAAGLARAYADNEPEYSIADVKKS